MAKRANSIIELLYRWAVVFHLAPARVLIAVPANRLPARRSFS
jgi:hypothetical protein